MQGHHGALQAVGSGIASEQSALAANWQGDTGMTYQAWQAQWNSAMEQLDLVLPGDGRCPRTEHDDHARPRRGRRRQVGLSAPAP